MFDNDGHAKGLLVCLIFLFSALKKNRNIQLISIGTGYPASLYV